MSRTRRTCLEPGRGETDVECGYVGERHVVTGLLDNQAVMSLSVA